MPIRICIVSALLFFASLPAQAQPDYYETRLSLQQPVANTGTVDTVVFHWSTFEVFGSVSTFELFDLDMMLYSAGTMVYEDTVVVGGEVQTFEGQTRIPEIGYFWDYSLTLGRLEQMVNASHELAVGTSGLHYTVNDSVSIPIDNVVDVSRFVDGALLDGQSDFLDVQTTTPMLFFDGFESGDTLLWTSEVPPVLRNGGEPSR